MKIHKPYWVELPTRWWGQSLALTLFVICALYWDLSIYWSEYGIRIGIWTLLFPLMGAVLGVIGGGAFGALVEIISFLSRGEGSMDVFFILQSAFISGCFGLCKRGGLRKIALTTLLSSIIGSLMFGTFISWLNGRMGMGNVFWGRVVKEVVKVPTLIALIYYFLHGFSRRKVCILW